MARQKYIAKRNSVLSRVESRRTAVSESIQDLQDEDEALAKVQAQAESQ